MSRLDSDNLAQWKRQVIAGRGSGLSRRDLLRSALAGAASAGLAAWFLGRPAVARAERPLPEIPSSSAPAGAAAKTVKTGTFVFPRLQFTVKDHAVDQWDVEPAGDVILRKRLAELTNINVSQDPVVVRLADLDHMARYPFVFMTSEGHFDLPAGEEKNLREFLLRGGFVLADDCVAEDPGDFFFRDYLKLMVKLFPDNPLKKVPLDHEIYHCYYDMPDGAPFMQGTNHGGYALFEKDSDRIMSFITPGDIHCLWCCRYAKKELNEQGIRMGVNAVIYYLTH